MSVLEKLGAIQCELKAPKGQYNSFGKYKYRSCEDILEAVKPLLVKHKCALMITDDLRMAGERYYISSTATQTPRLPARTSRRKAWTAVRSPARQAAMRASTR